METSAKAPGPTELIVRYAPEVRLHPAEQYLPSSVDWYLPRVSLYFNAGSADRPLIQATVTLENLTTQSYKYVDPDTGASKTYYSGKGDKTTGFFLAINDPTARNGNLSGIRCYAHTFTPAEDSNAIDIQYLFFFPYNGDIFVAPVFGTHEGDWEHVTVRVRRSDARIIGIFFSAHDNEGRWWTRQAASPSSHDGYLLNAEGHPIVYSALHSHASYPWAGSFKRLFGTADDQTADGGPVWKCWGDVVDVGTPDQPLNGQTWIAYTGRWGTLSGALVDFNGPYTPSFQGWWSNDPPLDDPTVIKQLIVAMRTGTEWPDWFDGPGTDGKVTFSIGRNGLTESWDLDNWGDDQQGGKTDTYTLIPKKDFQLSDLQFFNIHLQAVGTFGNDKWNLAHLRIWADGLVIFDQDVNKTFQGVDDLKMSIPSTLNPLMCAYRGKDKELLHWASFDQAAATWSPDQAFTKKNESKHGPSLAVLNGTLYCVHRGKSNQEQLYWATFDPGTNTWSEDHTVGSSASKSRPALAILNGTSSDLLYCAYRGSTDDYSLYWTVYDPTQGTWTPGQTFARGNQSKVGPALAVYQGILYCVHRGGNDDERLFWTTFDGTQWAVDVEFGGGDRCKEDPALAVFKGVLYCVHRGKSNDESLYWTAFDPDTQTWEVDHAFTTGNRSKTGPALAVLDSVLYCVYRGPTEDWTLRWATFDEQTRSWTEGRKFQSDNRTDDTPALALYSPG